MCQLVHTRGDYKDASGTLNRRGRKLQFIVKDFDFSVISETDIEKSKVIAEENAPKVEKAKKEADQAAKLKAEERKQYEKSPEYQAKLEQARNGFRGNIGEQASIESRDRKLKQLEWDIANTDKSYSTLKAGLKNY